jgi:hypothetical protein
MAPCLGPWTAAAVFSSFLAAFFSSTLGVALVSASGIFLASFYGVGLPKVFSVESLAASLASSGVFFYSADLGSSGDFGPLPGVEISDFFSSLIISSIVFCGGGILPSGKCPENASLISFLCSSVAYLGP